LSPEAKEEQEYLEWKLGHDIYNHIVSLIENKVHEQMEEKSGVVPLMSSQQYDFVTTVNSNWFSDFASNIDDLIDKDKLS